MWKGRFCLTIFGEKMKLFGVWDGYSGRYYNEEIV
jgi:hypothetical protein